METKTSRPSIVFCHGIWADGSSFSKVIPALQAEGHQVIAAQYGLNTFVGDVATVKRTQGRASAANQRPHHPTRAGTLLCKAHGRHDDRGRQQPRPHALPP